jgi:hypothetical protein
MMTPCDLRALLVVLAVSNAHAAEPSRTAVLGCLSASTISPSVKWKALPTGEINSQDDYQDGFDAIFYLVVEGKEIGYAKKRAVGAIVFDHQIYPVASARPLPGFSVRPTELATGNINVIWSRK